MQIMLALFLQCAIICICCECKLKKLRNAAVAAKRSASACLRNYRKALKMQVAAKNIRVPMAAKKAYGVGEYAQDLLCETSDVKEVLQKVLERFPEAQTSLKCIYWYRSKMMKEARAAGLID